MSHYNSFIVRVWTDEAMGQHRGQIQHVGTQETVYFANQNEMNEFIQSHLEPPQGNTKADQADILFDKPVISEDTGDPQ